MLRTAELETTLLFAVGLVALAIFAADLYVPLGVAVWALYFAPIALSFLSRRPGRPVAVAAACSLFLLLGYVLSDDHGASGAVYVPINRTFAFFSMWITALIGRRFIQVRMDAARESWLKGVQTALNTRIQGEIASKELGEKVLGFLAEQLGAHVGAIYAIEANAFCRRFATYAVDANAPEPEPIVFGSGLVGQAALDNRVLHVIDVPAKYLPINSGLGAHEPRELVVVPAAVDGRVRAVIELGFTKPVEPQQLELLARVAEPIASAVRAVSYRQRQAELLEETQRQAEELQTQQEELRVQNEELEEQSRTLLQSKTRLENQQAELEQVNTQLEEQTQLLEEQRDGLAMTQSELQRANRYKSEFLANMSHELRTPLNSSLILAKLLFDNRDGNLTAEQVKFARSIYTAGNDLLALINDILDLSKIEAGRLEVRPDDVSLERLLQDLENTFEPIAQERSLSLAIELEDRLPQTIYTDSTRLAQVLKNLLSNALKFTERGGVSLLVRRAGDGRIAFDVRDTGVGIPADQHALIFDAFRQANGNIDRKHGGTGLGLSISRDLARLLGGELTLISAPERGSTFTLLLPERYAPRAGELERAGARAASAEPLRRKSVLRKIAPAPEQVAALAPGSRAILIVEDDLAFANVLRDLARELEFHPLVAHTAEEGLSLALQHRPSAIVLDVGLPDRSGLSVLDALKHDAATRHIPVHVISASDYSRTALEMGAAGYAIKPIERAQLLDALRKLEAKFTQKLRRVLVVEDDATHREATCRLLSADDVETVAVGTASAALAQLRGSTFDCMVLDLSLPDRTGLSLLEEMSSSQQASFPPVIVYTGRSLSSDEEQTLRRFSKSIIIKGARSPERLLDEVTLFLHQVEAELPVERQRMLRDARHREAAFEGKRVLIVEDDVRNVFALTSLLEPKGAQVEIARNGREALDHLARKPGVDLVLMDIMMPEMDGLEATRRVREQPALARLPIIALTAKAMADDRESCLAAGANDYIAKPLDVDKLLSLARVWMAR